jgi:hypothetical protein
MVQLLAATRWALEAKTLGKPVEVSKEKPPMKIPNACDL